MKKYITLVLINKNSVLYSLLLILYGVELLELGLVLLLHAVDELPHEGHDDRILRKGIAYLQ